MSIDVHIDIYYKENTSKDEYCHRKAKKENLSGKFGTQGNNCDSPPILIKKLFNEFAGLAKEVDFVLYTGDTSRHPRDSQNPRTNSDVIRDHKILVNYVLETFKGDIQFVPTIGNNDLLKVPIKHSKQLIFSSQDNGSDLKYLYEELYEIWKPYNLDIYKIEKEKLNFLNGGYFMQSIPRAPKLKILSLNTQLLFDYSNDSENCDQEGYPSNDQLVWLQNTLEINRKEGNKVMIIGHVPPNNEKGEHSYREKCYWHFLYIVQEYSDVIKAQFAGHTNSIPNKFISR